MQKKSKNYDKASAYCSPGLSPMVLPPSIPPPTCSTGKYHPSWSGPLVAALLLFIAYRVRLNKYATTNTGKLIPKTGKIRPKLGTTSS